MVPEFQAYVGPRPFDEKDQDIFFGRAREVRDLLSTVIAHRLVLVYAQSGAGKTSLIKAGLIPLLKGKQIEVFPVARVKGPPLKNIKTDEISNIFIFNTLTSWAEGEYDFERLAKMKLVDFLNAREHILDDYSMPLRRAVIFDQFEEIFSLYQDRWKDREGFFEQVNTALEADPLLRVVFVMREEFIAQLDPYEDPLPERMWMRFHMERLRREAALLAITEPLKDTGRSFAEGVAEELVDDLLKSRVETIPGKIEEVKGEFIEAVQLQIVCQNLWQELPPDEKQVTHQHLVKYGNVEKALYKFYEGAIRAAAEKAGISEKGLRRLCGEVLITEMGTRGMVCRAPKFTGGVPNAAIDVLADMHLIRAEPRACALWYELTHDRFIKPIQDSNKVFNDRLAEKEWAEKERAERERAEKEWAEKERAERERRRSRDIKILKFAFVFLLFLVGYAFYQGYQAGEKAKEAQVSSLNLQSKDLIGDAKNLDKGILLAIVSFNISRPSTVVDQLISHVLNTDKLILQRSVADQLIRQGLLLIPHSVVVLHHNDSVNNVVFSPDGKYVATASGDKTARLWDAATGKQIFVLNHNNSVNNVVFSPDGKYVATASWDNTARLWDAATGKQIFDPLKHDAEVRNVVFSPDGKYIATASGDTTACLWDAATGERKFVLPHDGIVNNVVFSPDGKYVATASWDNTARLWDAATGKLIFDPLKHDAEVRNVVFSPDGKYVATASYDNTSRVWDASTGKQIFVLNHDGIVNNVVFSPSGKYVATASDDNTAGLWDVAATEVLNHNNSVYDVVFSPDGKYVATASYDNTARVWDAATGKQIFVLNHNGWVNNVVFSPDGKYVATASGDNTARVWDAATGKQIFVLNHNGWVINVVFSPDGKYVATASGDNTSRVWNASTGKQIFAPLKHDGWVWDVVFSPDGKYVATASGDTTACLWNASTGKLIFDPLKHDDPVNKIVFSPDGKYVATASSDKTARIWNTSTGERKFVLPHDGWVNGVMFSPNGKYVATASRDNTARLWVFSSTEDLINEARSRLTRNLTQEEWKDYIGD